MNLPEISIAGEKVFEVFGISITNTFILSLVISVGVFVFAFLSLRAQKMIPKKLQNFWEFLLESLFKFFNSITGSEAKTKEIFPLACTLFLLIIFCNLIELIPGLGIFKFLRAPSSDLNFTFALALLSVASVNLLAVKNLGMLNYLKKFVSKNPVMLFAGTLEGVGEFTRIISLAFRLFGNLFAGEILLIVISYLFSYILPLPFLGLEILVGFIQAFIFPTLIVIFYTIAIQKSHG
ncbi:MAG: F0F1 ATP synthase subunit A [Patescibacteria group bacterium]